MTTMTSSLNLDEEVRLYTNNAERERYTLLANLFGIVVSLDYLERAYVRDSVTAAEYVPRSPCMHSAAEHRRGLPSGTLIFDAPLYTRTQTRLAPHTHQEVLSGMHAPAFAIQDHAKARRRRRALYR